MGIPLPGLNDLVIVNSSLGFVFLELFSQVVLFVTLANNKVANSNLISQKKKITFPTLRFPVPSFP